METVADVVEQLTSAQAHGFDVTPVQAEKEVQTAIKKVAGISQWIKAELELGPTVAGQSVYGLPDKVIRLYDLLVGENNPYKRYDVRTLWDVKAGRAEVRGEGGVYAERFAADGTTKSFEIFPTPEETGVIVMGLASIVPDDLAAGVTLPFPEEHREAVLNFSVGSLYAKTDENRAQANEYEALARGVAESLALLANARTGSGPHKIHVAGHRRR